MKRLGVNCPICGGWKYAENARCSDCRKKDEAIHLQKVVLAFLEAESTKGAADKLGLSDKTVQYHLAKVRQQNGIGNLYGLIKWAFRTGLIYCLMTSCMAAPKAPKTSVLALYTNPTNGGTCTGGGEYKMQSTVTISAIPNTGWQFIRWDDAVTAATRQIRLTAPTVTRDAYFQQIPIPPTNPPPVVTNHWVTLAWNAVVSPDLSGYNAYWGPSSGSYTNHLHNGLLTTTTISNLVGTQFFCVKSMATNGFESVCSNEVQFTPP